MRKRVKFSGSPSICKPEATRDCSMVLNEGDHSLSFDGAKTSEFKSFKKLLEKAAHNHYFNRIDKNDNNQIKDKARNSMEEFKSTAKDNSVAGKLMLLSNITPINKLLHPSPQIIGKNSIGGHSGSIHEHKGTFSEKRACLLKLAAGICSQNADYFWSNSKDFIFEVLRRLGIKRNINKPNIFEKAGQSMNADLFPTSSSSRSSYITELCEKSPGNLLTHLSRQCDNVLTSIWDNTEASTFLSNRSLESTFKCEQWKPDSFNMKSCTFLPDFGCPALAIEMNKELDCVINTYHDDIKVPFVTDCPHIKKPYRGMEQFELCAVKDSPMPSSSVAELDFCRDFENCLHEQALIPQTNNISTDLSVHGSGLLQWLANEQIDIPSTLHTNLKSWSFFNVCGKRSFDDLQSCSYDLKLQDSMPASLLGKLNYFDSFSYDLKLQGSMPASLIGRPNYSDSNDHHNLVHSDFFRAARRDEIRWLLDRNGENGKKDDANTMGVSESFPVSIFDFTELQHEESMAFMPGRLSWYSSI